MSVWEDALLLDVGGIVSFGCCITVKSVGEIEVDCSVLLFAEAMLEDRDIYTFPVCLWVEENLLAQDTAQAGLAGRNQGRQSDVSHSYRTQAFPQSFRVAVNDSDDLEA